MEGLDEEVATGGAASVVPSESTMVERWLVLGCLVVVLLGIGFALAANILSSISAW
jgi:hypothetical protein